MDDHLRRQHNYGIDLLKIVTIYMVVILHLQGAGGTLGGTANGSLNHHAVWLLETLSYGAVNTFAMISGWLTVDRKFRSGRVLSVWFQGLFYSVGITVLFSVFSSQSVDLKTMLAACFPVSTKQWWYLTSYVCMSLFVPFVNRLMQGLTKRQTGVLMGSILLVATIATMNTDMDMFMLGRGYSPVWLMFMYILGAGQKKHDFVARISHKWFTVTYVGAAVLAWSSRIVMPYVTQAVFGDVRYQNIFASYTSPFVIVMAASLLLFFAKLQVPTKAGKIAGAVAPLTFGVYLIHEQYFVRTTFISGKLTGLADANVLWLVVATLLLAVGVFAVCMGVEWLRTKLFALVRIPQLTQKLAAWIDGKLKLV